MKYVFSICFFLFAFFSVQAQETKLSDAEAKIFREKITAESKKIKTLQADFTETKTMALLKKPAVSSGKMSVQIPNTLSWKYTSPETFAFIFKNEKIYITKNGKTTSTAAKNKMFSKLSQLIMGSVNGTLFTNPDFIVRYSKSGKKTAAKFIPKSQTLLKYIKFVTLYFADGQNLVQQVNLQDASGDLTEINFKNIQVNAAVPQSAFEP